MAENTPIKWPDWWNLARSQDGNFRANTPKGTDELFTERGWESLNSYPGGPEQAVKDWLHITMPFTLKGVDISKAHNPLRDSGIGKDAGVTYGELMQQLAVQPIKAITPQFRDVPDGSTKNPYFVRKSKVSERWFRRNFDYQNAVSIPYDWEWQRMFLNPEGASEVNSGIIAQMDEAYVEEEYYADMEAINAAVNPKVTPLQATQKVTLKTAGGIPTADELINFVYQVNLILSYIKAHPRPSAFNSSKFPTTVDTGRLKILVRTGYKALVDLLVSRNSYHAESMKLPVDVVEVPHFGGLQPYKEVGHSTPLYPVYDTYGAMIGYNTAPDQSEVTVATDAAFMKDPNPTLFAVLVDPEFLLRCDPRAIVSKWVDNPLLLVETLIHSRPDAAIVTDSYRTLVRFDTTVPVLVTNLDGSPTQAAMMAAAPAKAPKTKTAK